MTNEVVNVPELRFTGFEDEWKKKKLDDVANYRRGSFPQPYGNKEWYDEKNGEPFVQVVDVDKNMKLHDKTKQKISDLAKPKSVKGFKGDIVVTLQGSIGRVALLHYDAYIDRTLLLIDSFKIEMNKNYFKYVLYLLFLKEKERAPGGTIKTITKKVLSNFKIDIPNVGEQEKIGEFFSKLDRQIELEEQKLEKLEEQKKGYMQKIFSQELRFKDENGNDYPEWEDKLISDIGKVVTGNTPSKKDNDYWNSNQYVWVTPTDISNKKNIYTSGYQLSQKGFSKARQLPKNTLLITCIASIGKNAILRIEGSCNQQINAVIPNDNYDVDYLYYAFEDVSKLMKSIAGKTATQIVNKAVFEKLLLNVPIYEEQQKISGFLNKVDILIDKQTQKIDELKLRKQGFLQKMFV